MRVFIAVEISDEVKKKVLEIENRFMDNDFKIKFITPENLHITLKFLGEVDEGQVKGVKESLNCLFKSISSFSVSINGVGYFGNKNYIKVLWCGIDQGREQIIHIVEQLNNTLSHIRKDDFEPDPHLTIGRVVNIRNKEKLFRILEELKDVKIGETFVNEIKLKKSVLTPEGPVYSDLDCFRLE